MMISRNTVLPARSVCRFKTLKDNQPSVEVNVIEGGDDSGNDATQIGRCIVSGLPAGLPADTPVEVTFQYESNGRLAIGANVPSVDKQAQLEIERATGLASDEIEYWSSRINSGFGLQDADSVPPPAVDEIAEAPAPPPVPAEVAEPPDTATAYDNLEKYGALHKAHYMASIEQVPGDYLEFGVFSGSSLRPFTTRAPCRPPLVTPPSSSNTTSPLPSESR